MAAIRTRLIFWLFKAYLKRWGKQFLTFFIFGLFVFFLLYRFYPVIARLIPLENKKIIGISGAFTKDEIPEFIISKVASGLTKVADDGKILPNLARTWEIKKNGRVYVFHLKKNITFTDGSAFTAKSINYAFKDVKIARPDDFTVIFNLENEYSPFLVSVSKPVFRKGFIGTGEYILNNIQLNGDFIKSIQLISKNNKFKSEEYIFYPTSEALKIALALGEITAAHGLMDTSIISNDFQAFPNLKINKYPNYAKLITLFFNTQDPLISDKKLRNALSYALPDNLPYGIRSYHPYSPKSVFINYSLNNRMQNIEHAKLLISPSLETSSNSAQLIIKLKTLKKYYTAAKIIKNSWQKLGIKIDLEEVDSIPSDFQVYLGDFNLPKDPDQYTLWHSGQKNNITKLKNLRIDKLLEDGRRTLKFTERINIYNDFQKYLADESPAAFLYFPYEYHIQRK